MIDIATSISEVPGFRATGAAGGIKKNANLDVALISSDLPCVAAGVFTRNIVKAAPVLLGMETLQANPTGIRAVVINSGNANACTGEQGMNNARETATYVASKLGANPQDILVMSTGVIGQQINMDAVKRGIDHAHVADSEWYQAAQAIMTTDTRPKQASVLVELSGGICTIAGITKGSGMIAPNMATMLATIVTDAVLTVGQAQSALQGANHISFNRIVVDGDMSTNDTVLLLANGTSGVKLETHEDEMQFNLALTQLCITLAKAIVRDGEGASKFITLMVKNAPDDDAASQIAHTVAVSPLVKTAFYGSDANWGRILAAVGYSGIPLDPQQISVAIQAGEQPTDPFVLFNHGAPHNDEATASAIMQSESISVVIDCGAGYGEAVVWTCDLSHEYVSINADYRT